MKRRVWSLAMAVAPLFPAFLSAQTASPAPDEPEKTVAEMNGADDLSPDGNKRVRGTITDEQGESIIGATVMVKDNPAIGTVSDVDGRFALEVPQGATLVVSFVGYNTREIPVRQRINNYPVVLREDNQLLDEVVVIGYGTVKKSDLTGAVAGVNTRQFKNQPVRRVEDVLQGRATGVEVTASSGLPGAGMKVRVRGTTSINKSSDPLYVIDGLISPSGLSGLNPSDIQSMEVLKDASSTAIYGSRGANGVILITTRQGTEGRARVEFDANIGISTLRKSYDLMNAYEYGLALNELRGSSIIPEADLEAYRTGAKGIDWIDLMTQTALTQDYRLSVSGGSEKVRYLVSGNVLDQEAITITSKRQTFGLRANVDADVKPWLTISTKLNGSRIHQHNGAPNWSNVISFSPTMELVDPATGIYNRDPYNVANASNPYGEMIVNESDSYAYNLNANVTFLFKIIDGLTLSVQGGYDYKHSPSYSFASKLVAPGSINSASNSSALHNYWQNTNNLTWQKTFGDHTVSAMGVWELSYTNDTGLTGSGSNLNNESVGYWNLGNAAIRNASNSYSEASLMSGIVRANYDYKKRYFLTAAIRADGSSKFQDDHKWGYFPSAAVAWDIAQEPFMQAQKILSQLKLRGSFGVTGNQDIGAYSTLGMLSGATYGWGTSTPLTGYWGNQFATPDITWDKTYQYDFGLDLIVCELQFTFDWFKKHTKDLLFQKQVPRYNGGGTYWVNNGELDNTGVELSISAFPVKSAVTWETTFNASYVKNTIRDLAGDDFVLTANYSDLGGAMQIMKPGYPLGSFYVYQWKGFDENGANLYLNAAGELTTTPTSEDLVIKGQASPKWTFGWNNNITWRNWTLNIFFNAATGYERLNISRFRIASMTGNTKFVTLHDAYYKGWDHVANKAEALYPSLRNGENKVYANSDFWLEDASFLKLKNISLSYRIPRRVAKIASIEVSVSAQDVFTLTKYKGMDPEVYAGYDGLDYGAYPIPRTVTFGAKVTF